MEKQYQKTVQNNKAKIISPKWNDEFESPDGSYSESDIQYYIKYSIKKHETLASIPPIHVYINAIKNRLVFKIKDGYKLIPKTIKLFGSTKKLIGKTKNGRKVLSLEVVEVVSFRYILVDNQYQQTSEELYLFTPNKSSAYLLNVKPNNLVFSKITILSLMKLS